MSQIYNGGQSPLENYAINGHPLYPGSGRLAIIQQTKIGSTKYVFQGPYKNPQITGNASDSYGINNTNALTDDKSPYNGRGTGDGVINGTYQASTNYNGGNIEVKLGAIVVDGSGRNSQISLNAGIWGYGPSQIAGAKYVTPDMAGNVGQVII